MGWLLVFRMRILLEPDLSGSEGGMCGLACEAVCVRFNQWETRVGAGWHVQSIERRARSEEL